MTASLSHIVPFEPRRFRSTVDYYGRYRVPYPDELIAGVAARVGLAAGEAVLDLGCGPGPLAVAFARLGARVTAMDPEPDMLAAAGEAAAQAGVHIERVQGSSYDLTPELGRFRLVTMGRSFHWMDRAATLGTLDRLVLPGGAVALFRDRPVSSAPDWRPLLETLGERFSPERWADRQRRQKPDFPPHEAVLLHSPFSYLERVSRIVERRIDADAIVGRAYSMSVTSPEALGPAREAFEAALRDELARLAPDGTFTEIVEIDALLAFRDAGHLAAPAGAA